MNYITNLNYKANVKKGKYDKYGTVDENEFDFEEFITEFNDGFWGHLFGGIDDEVNWFIKFKTK